MLNNRQIRFQDKTFQVAVASTAQDLTRGLSGVASMEALGADGMLFDFGVDHAAIMTSRGMLFPIEVGFLDAAGVVREILTLHPNYGHHVYASKPVRYALEVSVGFFSDHQIIVGSTIQL